MTTYRSAPPFPHNVQEAFLDAEHARQISADFPNTFSGWHVYNNPIEVKYTNNDVGSMPESIQRFFALMASDAQVRYMRDLTGIPDLVPDPHLHGAGMHVCPRHGRLGIHLDYEKHPISAMQRRVNIIYFVCTDDGKGWDQAWNGALELWAPNACGARIFPMHNRAAIFNTTEESWHGVPAKVTCPAGVYRKSLAFYYVSPMHNQGDPAKAGARSDSDGYRTKATFRHRPDVRPEQVSKRMQQLYSIRPVRRISPEDMKRIWPDWDPATDAPEAEYNAAKPRCPDAPGIE